MKDKESQKYCCIDYVGTFVQTEAGVDKWCRSKMVQWCYSVVDFARFSRETVYISISYLDRFLSSNSPQSLVVLEDRKDFQLAAMTCLYLAIKVHEPKIIETGLLSELSRGCYTPQDFQRMELNVLFDLKWHLHDPTPQSYLMYFLALIPSQKNNTRIDRKSVLELARYQIELSVVEYDLMTQSASNIALAALISSARLILSDHRVAINEAELFASMGKIFRSDLDLCGISDIVQKLEDLHNKKIPDLLRREINPSGAETSTEVDIKDRQRRSSLSPNSCMST